MRVKGLQRTRSLRVNSGQHSKVSSHVLPDSPAVLGELGEHLKGKNYSSVSKTSVEFRLEINALLSLSPLLCSLIFLLRNFLLVKTGKVQALELCHGYVPLMYCQWYLLITLHIGPQNREPQNKVVTNTALQWVILPPKTSNEDVTAIAFAQIGFFLENVMYHNIPLICLYIIYKA